MNHWISIKQACSFLKVSRPTLNNYRKKYKLQEIYFKGCIRLSKNQLIQKIILKNPIENYIDVTMTSNFDLSYIQPLSGVFDLRRISSIDSYGTITLLCAVYSYLKKDSQNNIHFILDSSFVCGFLDAVGFFTEIERLYAKRIFVDKKQILSRPQFKNTIILPLHLIGYKGAEKKILEELYTSLLHQGFSKEYCGYIGWIIGEICDNAHIHSHKPCYLIIESITKNASRCLTFAIGDIGIGIPSSLKKNSKYASLNHKKLLCLAFKSEVSSMEEHLKRGKGLNDILSIIKGNSSLLRVETGQTGLFFNFSKKKVSLLTPKINIKGTRFALSLIDSDIKSVSRNSINKMLDNIWRKL